jgi:LuxR family maltose regulon positive regulatory protein
MWGTVDALMEGFLNLARIDQAQNNIPEANRALAKVSQAIHEHLLDASTSQWIGAIRARLWLAQGKLDVARLWAKTRGLSEEGKFDPGNEVEYLTLVRILLAEGRVDEATHLLSRLQTTMESAGRHGSLIEVFVLRAIALERKAGVRSALAVLEQSVSLARSEGYMRVFLDEGKPIETLLKIAVTKWREPDLVAYARKLLAAFAAASVSPAEDQGPHSSILSERELEVLRLMAAGCTNQAIADELVIAIGTAKRHAANIFDKLDVRNRTEAVTKGRQLGLL